MGITAELELELDDPKFLEHIKAADWAESYYSIRVKMTVGKSKDYAFFPMTTEEARLFRDRLSDLLGEIDKVLN